MEVGLEGCARSFWHCRLEASPRSRSAGGAPIAIAVGDLHARRAGLGAAPGRGRLLRLVGARRAEGRAGARARDLLPCPA
eukprot:1145684-Pyramimonas_sp.AAC.1